MSWPSSRTRRVGRRGLRVSEEILATIRELLAQCSPEEQAALFRELRVRHLIHEFEEVVGAPAEMILEAVHRAPELTRRMLRGVIADAAFRQFAVLPMTESGWRDVTPAGNFAFDYKLEDDAAFEAALKQRRELGDEGLIRSTETAPAELTPRIDHRPDDGTTMRR